MHLPVANESIDPVVTRTETPQLHFLAVLDLLCITITPFHRYIGIRVCVHKNIESTITVQLGKERHRGGNLAKDGLNLILDLLLGLLRGWLDFSLE